MTDARFPEKLLADRRLLKLSPADFRSYTMAMIWSVSNRTDGRILSDELSLIPLFGRSAAARLVAAELWTDLGTGYQIVDFEAWQTSRNDLQVLENIRAADKEKKARKRAHDKDDHSLCNPEVCEVLVLSPGLVPGTAQDRTGQAFNRAESEKQKAPWAKANAVPAPSVLLPPRSNDIPDCSRPHKWTADGTCANCLARREAKAS